MESLRRISATLFVLSALVAGITILASSAVSCPLGTSCLGAVFTAEERLNIIPSTSKLTTDVAIEEKNSMSDFVILTTLIRSVSTYLLVATALILIALEIRELHYLKELSIKRRRKA